MARRTRPAVFTIPPGTPFLPVLADAILDGRVAALDRRDPLALADATVYLPTRRAARAFAEVLLDRLGGKAAILPSIRPIGDVDEEERLFDAPAAAGDDIALLPEAISPFARRLALIRMTLAWAQALNREPTPAPGDGEASAIPGSAADAARLAGDLARLIDDVAIAGVSWDALPALAPEDHARYFQITLDFLAIVSRKWPAWLREIGRSDPAARRDALIRAEAGRLAAGGARGPVIAAGSTGSVPATARLLAAIAGAPQGAVVLPGLDLHLDADGWAAVDGRGEAPPAAWTHPQFGLTRLLADIGVDRNEVVSLGPPTGRAALLSRAMCPAETSDVWRDGLPDDETAAALAGVDLAVARNEQEEAAAIALAMREAVETPGRTAALVTPDRGLARRVAAALSRWDLAVDDSAGASLADAEAGRFCRLVAACMMPEVAAVDLMALLKHPLALFGLAPGESRRAARALEMAALRGCNVDGAVGNLAAEIAAARATVGRDRVPAARVPVSRRYVSQDGWRRAENLADRLAEAFAPVAALGGGRVDVVAATRALTGALKAIAADGSADDTRLWTAEGGEQLARFLTELMEHRSGELVLPPADYGPFLAALMAEVDVPREAPADSRLHIWGALEARLQSVDLLILGGLDEGVWPAAVRTDAWLSRAMRAELGLPPPERRLGLAAHDFAAGFAAPRVICTRAAKRGGAPTVEARWLQRLRAVAGDRVLRPAFDRGARLLALARMADEVADTRPVEPPNPKPPVERRPERLRITDIEKLIRDPYAVYAQRILNLEPFDAIGAVADRALRGTLFHDALARFTDEWTGPYDHAALRRLEAIAAEVLAGVADTPETYAVWSQRFAAIAAWLIGWEAARDADVAGRHAEVDGELAVRGEVGSLTLRGRADRIDLMRDGRVAIYDYKTGSPPTDKQVYAGLSPQMTLEAAMVRDGAFGPAFAGRSIAELAWLAIGRVGRDDPYTAVAARGETPDALAERALALLRGLVDAFADPAHGYLSRARPMLERHRGDYDHLARVQEWSLQDAEEDYL